MYENRMPILILQASSMSVRGVSFSIKPALPASSASLFSFFPDIPAGILRAKIA